MRTIEVERIIEAPRSNVWTVLADFPNIASWTPGVPSSFSTSDATEGVGAQRHCDLAPAGALEETIQVWEPEARLEISIDSARGLPIHRGLAKFALEPNESGTRVIVAYSYQPKFGFLGELMGRLVMDGQLTKGFPGLLEDLDRAAHGASP